MNRIIKVCKYHIFESVRSVAIFYIVIILLLTLLPLLFPGVKMKYEGMGLSTTIFLFVMGLNSFKQGYLFLQANGVTRRLFYTGGVIAITAVALAMTAFDAALYAVANLYQPVTQSFSPLLYPGIGYLDSLLWTLALNLFAAFAGWFVTMLFYRSNKPVKLAISLSPILFSVGLPLLDSVTGCWGTIGFAILCAMGLSGIPNAAVGSATLLAGSVAFAALSFLLVRRAPVKRQDG